MDGNPPRGLRWGELFLGLGFLLANAGAAFIPGRNDVQFFARFWLAWMSFAAFVGLSAFLVLVMRNTRVLRHAAVSVVIVTGIALSLRDQHFFASSGLRNWLFNLAAIIGLVACVRANRGLPGYVRAFAIPVTVFVLCDAVLWALLSPCQIFLPVMFFPDADLAAARSVFIDAFLSGVAVSLVVCAAVAFCLSRREGARDRTTFFDTPVSLRSGVRMAAGFAILVATAALVLYFIPGVASGSGGAGVEFFRNDESGEYRVPVDEVSRYLQEKGFQPLGSGEKGFRPFAHGEPLAWFRYPLSGSHDLELCLLRDRDRGGALYLYFRYAGVSIFKAHRARDMMETVRRHFWEAWLSSRHRP